MTHDAFDYDGPALGAGLGGTGSAQIQRQHAAQPESHQHRCQPGRHRQGRAHDAASIARPLLGHSWKQRVLQGLHEVAPRLRPTRAQQVVDLSVHVASYSEMANSLTATSKWP